MDFEGELLNERLMAKRGREITLHRARKERLGRLRDLAVQMLQLMPQGLTMEKECEEIKRLIDEVQTINKKVRE
jgi:Na+/phosphate symporter